MNARETYLLAFLPSLVTVYIQPVVVECLQHTAMSVRTVVALKESKAKKRPELGQCSVHTARPSDSFWGSQGKCPRESNI